VGCGLAAERGLAFAPVEEGLTVRGKPVGSTQLASGRSAMIDNGLGLGLSPWRPALESKIGRKVMGEMRCEDVSWQFGRGRTLGIGIYVSQIGPPSTLARLAGSSSARRFGDRVHYPDSVGLRAASMSSTRR
jgi:hypothetical protein